MLKVEEGTSAAGMVTLGRAEFELLCSKLNGLENSIADLRRELHRSSSERGRHDSNASLDPSMHSAPETEAPMPNSSHTDVHGLHTKNEAGEIVHFGGGSLPAMLYALGQGKEKNVKEKRELQELMGKSMLPLFGLDNESATYPFVDLWGLPHGSRQRAQELARALPNDAQMLQLFRYYRDLGFVVYPGIADPHVFEDDLNSFLNNRAAVVGPNNDGVSEEAVYGKSYHWMGVLFAVLGSGAQCSPMPRKERELTSQVYICCSFECLRFTNFLSQPNLESIQALLIICHVMANNMNAGTAWSMLGLAIRLAQGLGLHRSCPPYVPNDLVVPRSKTWWGIIWLDSLLAITYDRAGSTAALDITTMPMPEHYAPVPQYHSIMYRLCKVGLDIVRHRATAMNPRDRYAGIMEHREAIANIMRDSAEYLRDSRKCTSTRETIEHWGTSRISLCPPHAPANINLYRPLPPHLLRSFRALPPGHQPKHLRLRAHQSLQTPLHRQPHQHRRSLPRPQQLHLLRPPILGRDASRSQLRLTPRHPQRAPPQRPRTETRQSLHRRHDRYHE